MLELETKVENKITKEYETLVDVVEQVNVKENNIAKQFKKSSDQYKTVIQENRKFARDYYIVDLDAFVTSFFDEALTTPHGYAIMKKPNLSVKLCPLLNF